MPPQPRPQTKTCAQCKRSCEKDQFPKKQWKRQDALCRVCFELSIISDEKSRQCRECKLDRPRSQYNIFQWEKGADALCHGCTEKLTQKCLASIGSNEINLKRQPDGTFLCAHSLEMCDICMVSYTLQNKFTRKRALLGRDLTEEENQAIIDEDMKETGFRINRKICILDGQPVCPRSGRKLRCPCNEVTYCSQACQRHHWTIHKMTCKFHAEKKKAKAKKADQPKHGLTEEEVEYIMIEAFMAENRGVVHAIEECAWQLGVHPLVIGGGSIIYGPNGQEFKKGDVAKIYKEKEIEYDGTPRFGMRPYEQKKTPFDWIAKAKGGKSMKKDELEKLMKEMGLK